MPTELHDIATLAGHHGRITAIDFAPGRRDVVLSAGQDGAVAVWTIDGATSAEAELVRHDAPVRSAQFWPDERGLLLTSADGTARLIDLDRGDEVGRYTTIEAMKADAERPSGLVHSINQTVKVAGSVVAAIMPMGAIFTAASEQSNKSSPVLHAAADARTERVATVTEDHNVTLYDLISAEPIGSWSVPADNHAKVAFAAGRLHVAGSSRLLSFDETADKPTARTRLTRSAIRGLFPLDATRLMAFDASKTFTIWDAERRSAAGGFRAPFQPVHACPVGRDRVLVADARRFAVVATDTPSDPEIHKPEGGKVRAVAASDDGTRIAIASDDLRLRVFVTPGA